MSPVAIYAKIEKFLRESGLDRVERAGTDLSHETPRAVIHSSIQSSHSQTRKKRLGTSLGRDHYIVESRPLEQSILNLMINRTETRSLPSVEQCNSVPDFPNYSNFSNYFSVSLRGSKNQDFTVRALKRTI